MWVFNEKEHTVIDLETLNSIEIRPNPKVASSDMGAVYLRPNSDKATARWHVLWEGSREECQEWLKTLAFNWLHALDVSIVEPEPEE